MSEPTPGAANPVAPKPETAEPGKRLWPKILAIVGIVVVACYAVAVFYVSGDVPPKTTVMGVEIGGMSSADAAQKLEKQLTKKANATITVEANGKEMEIKPADAGLTVDWVATAEQDSGIVLNPIKLVSHLTGAVTLKPVTTADTDQLTESIKGLTDVVNTEPVEPKITYTKVPKAKLTPGVPGATIDVKAATALVADSYLDGSTDPIVIPMTETPPTVSDAAAEKVLKDFAEPAISADVTLVVAGVEDATVGPKDISTNLTFTAKDATLVPELDAQGLHKALANQLQGVEKPGRDASFKIVKDKPVVVPSKDGKALDNKDLATAVMAVLPETDPDKRVATVKVTASEADFTTAEAKALKITEKLSTFLQAFPPAPYRYTNVGQAAEYMDGTVLKPGDTFSMNDTVKERTRENGYTEGTIIANGVFREELGGGVSIITTATWTAAFYAGLERIEQHAHGLYISRYTAGLEATVSWGYIDLKFRNNTPYGVLITATRYNDGVRITMWGKKTWDKVTSTFTERHNFTNYETIYDPTSACVPSVGSQGFSIAVTRRIIKDGKSIKTETWPTTYKPTPNVICGPKPGAKPSSSATPSDKPTS